MDQPASELLSSPDAVDVAVTFSPSVALSFISTSQYLVPASRVESAGAEKSFLPVVAKFPAPLANSLQPDGLVSVYFSAPGLFDVLVYMAATKFVISAAFVGNAPNHMAAVLSV